jgi:hypothetical protein
MYCRIDITDNVTVLLRLANGKSEENKALRISPSLVVVWKMCTDIAECESAEDRIGDRVGQNVRIRMPIGTKIRIDGNATNDQWSALNKSVSVAPKTDPHHSITFGEKYFRKP